MKRKIECSVCPLYRWVEVDPVNRPGQYRRVQGKTVCKCPEDSR